MVWKSSLLTPYQSRRVPWASLTALKLLYILKCLYPTAYWEVISRHHLIQSLASAIRYYCSSITRKLADIQSD